MARKATETDNSFEAFATAVRASCEKHAQRKNYTRNGINGPNQMVSVMAMLNIHKEHCLGEIFYKCAEYLTTPRRVLLEKIAGWAFILWRETSEGALK